LSWLVFNPFALLPAREARPTLTPRAHTVERHPGSVWLRGFAPP